MYGMHYKRKLKGENAHGSSRNQNICKEGFVLTARVEVKHGKTCDGHSCLETIMENHKITILKKSIWL